MTNDRTAGRETKDALVAEIADLEQEKAKLDALAERALESVQTARDRLGTIKSRAMAHRIYAPPEEYRAAEEEVRTLGRDHQRLLKSAGKVNSILKAARHRLLMLGDREAVTEHNEQRTFYQHFVRVAKAMLPKETYDVLAEAAAAAERQQETGAARKLTGQVLPALGGYAGVRRRA